MKYTWPANSQAPTVSLLRGWQADTTLATAGPTHPQTSVQQMCFDLHVSQDRGCLEQRLSGCLASECLTMANLSPGGTLIRHPSSQAEAFTAVSIALAL